VMRLGYACKDVCRQRTSTKCRRDIRINIHVTKAPILFAFCKHCKPEALKDYNWYLKVPKLPV